MSLHYYRKEAYFKRVFIDYLLQFLDINIIMKENEKA